MSWIGCGGRVKAYIIGDHNKYIILDGVWSTHLNNV